MFNKTRLYKTRKSELACWISISAPKKRYPRPIAGYTCNHIIYYYVIYIFSDSRNFRILYAPLIVSTHDISDVFFLFRFFFKISLLTGKRGGYFTFLFFFFFGKLTIFTSCTLRYVIVPIGIHSLFMRLNNV